MIRRFCELGLKTEPIGRIGRYEGSVERGHVRAKVPVARNLFFKSVVNKKRMTELADLIHEFCHSVVKSSTNEN